MKRAEYKIPGGKLLAAELTVEGDRMVGVKITGDFFMHPETAIIELEKALENTPIQELEDTGNRFFRYRRLKVRFRFDAILSSLINCILYYLIHLFRTFNVI